MGKTTIPVIVEFLDTTVAIVKSCGAVYYLPENPSFREGALKNFLSKKRKQKRIQSKQWHKAYQTVLLNIFLLKPSSQE